MGWLSSDAPDTSGINAAALANANLSKEQMDFVRGVYADGATDRADASAQAKRTAALQETATGQQIALTDKYADQQDKQFGFEDRIRADATNYDTPEREAANAAKATADVNQAFASSQDQQTRALSRQGVNPNSGKSLAMANQLGIAKASALAGASNKARLDTETQGYARKMDSANLGRNLASSQATSAQTAMNLGNSGVNNAQVPLTVAQGGVNMMNSGFSGAGNLNQSSGNLYASSANITQQANASNDAMIGAIGGAAGKFMMMSDFRLKTDIRGLNKERALQAINKTPVSKWRYKAGSKADDGGMQHTGPMAQDVQKHMGDKAAPDGTKIDLISMNGVTMAAIQALSDKVDRLAGPRGLRRSA